MKITKPGLLLGIASALLVVAFVAWDSRKISPGPLSAVHAQPGAADESNCASCHGEGDRSMATACNECHTAVAEQLAGKKGFHGTLEGDATRCGTCHGEHHGAEFRPVSPQSFALAGVADVHAYRHEGLGFELVGDHVALDCKRCHEHADDLVLGKGNRRFGGKSQACATCHDDPHQGKLPDCASCHGQVQPFANVAEFRHPASFALTGAHAKPGCLECHAKGTAFAIEASGVSGGSGQATRTARTCSECHESPHRTEFVARVASELALAAGASCESCHATDRATFRGGDARLTPAQHALTGFELAPPHDRPTCAQCHTPNELLKAAPANATPAAAFRALHPGRASDDCASCHVDVHGGQFATGRFAGRNCLACHDRLVFQPVAFDAARHDRDTAFALTGKHATTDCAGCHAQPSPTAPRQFHGTSNACASCHADAHQGFFERPGVPTSFQGQEGCARCHTTDAFGPVETKRFDHATWTGFALEGEHADAACTTCHPRTARADATGRTFGRVSDVFRGSPERCETCHADVHRGAFDASAPNANAATEHGCARCHDVRGFSNASKGFDHAAWTPFALTGAHARAECTTCHEPRAQPDKDGRRFGFVSEQFPGPSNACSTCHVDVHGGAFDKASMPTKVDGRDGCERCHVTESFAQLRPNSFDHGRWAGYPLEGAHARASCESCHPRLATPERDGRSFGRAAGTSCQACHVDSHVGQFARVDAVAATAPNASASARAGTTDCSRCHTTGASFHELVFDHDRDSRFALDATHEKVACSKCHVPSPLQDGRTAIRYKPMGTTCGDCHDPRRR